MILFSVCICSCMSSSQLWWPALWVNNCVCGQMLTTTGLYVTLLLASWPRFVKLSVLLPTISSPVLPRRLLRWVLVLYVFLQYGSKCFVNTPTRRTILNQTRMFLQSLLDDKTQWTTRYGCIAGLAEVGPDVSGVIFYWPLFIKQMTWRFIQHPAFVFSRWSRHWFFPGFL